MQVNWTTLTQAQAKRLLAPASRAETQAAERFEASGSREDEAAMLRAYTLWEDLKVFAICGERPV